MKKRTKKAVSLFLATSLLALTLCGCGGNNDKTPDKQGEARTNLVVGVAAEPSTLDPCTSAGASINENMALCLTSLGADLSVNPSIAKSWTVSDDEMTYTFEIDTDIKFANGDNVTVDDILFSLERSRAYAGNSQYFDCVDTIEKEDDTHVRFTLKYPCGLFLAYMSDSSTTIVCQKVVEAAGEDYGINPAGSCAGPYDFVSWEKGVCVKLTANPYYRGELKIKDVEFRFITEASTGAISVEAGDIDIYTNPNYIDVENLRENNKVSIYEQVLNGFDFIGFNTINPPFDNMKVRQAIAYSFDREELVDAAIGTGGAEPAVGLCADFVVGHSDNLKAYTRDNEKAKALLAEAGYPNGLEISIITMDGSRGKVAEYLQDALKASNITVKIETVEWSKFVDDLINGNLGAFIIGVSGDVPDADGLLYPQFHSEGGQNVHNYSNPQVDEKLYTARQSSNTAERVKLYEEVQQILLEELPCIPLYFNTRYMLYNSALKNFTSNYAGDVLAQYMSW